MSLFDRIFGKQRKAVAKTQIVSEQVTFTAWSGNAYENVSYVGR